MKRNIKKTMNCYRLVNKHLIIFKNLIIFVVVVSALSLVVGLAISTCSPHWVNAKVQTSTTKGTFNYTQIDTSGHPTWINTGNWSLIKSPSAVFSFDAVINMAKPNGSGNPHQHRVGHLAIPYAPLDQTNSTIIKGTTTLTMNNGFFVSGVPTIITLSEKNISVNFDPAKIGNHFDNQSIIGLVAQ